LGFIGYNRSDDKKERNVLWVKKRVLLMTKPFLIKFKAYLRFLARQAT